MCMCLAVCVCVSVYSRACAWLGVEDVLNFMLNSSHDCDEIYVENES